MRIVVDTNIAFSAILNSNSLIARILFQPKSILNFYSTDLLLLELQEHKDKILQLSGYSDSEIDKLIEILTKKIKFIDIRLIPVDILLKTQELLMDIDIDDTEFVALATHIRGRLWSGDKVLQTGLFKKGWNKSISTKELYEIISK